MRYMIDDRDAEPETSLSLFRTVITWTAIRSDSFVIALQPKVYDNPDDVTRLCLLGQVVAASGDVVQVKGTPNETFIWELTKSAAPPKAVSGDVCPVEDVKLFIGERLLYALYDYGRVQILDLTFEEFKNLNQTLKETGLDPSSVIPAPQYITDSD
jgi:hypothetical protein